MSIRFLHVFSSNTPLRLEAEDVLFSTRRHQPSEEPTKTREQKRWYLPQTVWHTPSLPTTSHLLAALSRAD